MCGLFWREKKKSFHENTKTSKAPIPPPPLDNFWFETFAAKRAVIRLVIVVRSVWMDGRQHPTRRFSLVFSQPLPCRKILRAAEGGPGLPGPFSIVACGATRVGAQGRPIQWEPYFFLFPDEWMILLELPGRSYSVYINKPFVTVVKATVVV